MRAAVFLGDGRIAIEDRPEPRIEGPDDVLIEVDACGICGSDLQILAVPPGHPARPGTILGHEFVGRVRAVGTAVTQLAPGQRVVVDPDPKCGRCDPCRAGRPATCVGIVALGIFRDGALAPFVVAPAAAVYPIADEVPAEIAALVEPLACVINGTNRAAVRPGESVIVFGAGAIGCLFVAVFRAAGASPIVVVEPSAKRATVARAVGADVVMPPEGLGSGLAEVLPSGADVVVDAVGTALSPAIEVAALGGRIVVFGMNAGARAPIHQIEITEKGLTILGSYISNFTFPAAIRLVESGRLDLAPIVGLTLPLERTAEALDRLRAGEVAKVVILPRP